MVGTQIAKARTSISRAAWAILLAFLSPSVNASSGCEILLAPIPGLTSDWHPAPNEISVPAWQEIDLGAKVPDEGSLTWTGASEKERVGSMSIASVRVAPGETVSVLCQKFDTHSGTSWGQSILHGIEVPPEGLRLLSAGINSAARNHRDSSFEEELRRFRTGSIADVDEISPGEFVTSVNRTIELQASVLPPALSSLLEWRYVDIDGTPRALLGASPRVQFPTPGFRRLWVGPELAGPRSIGLQVYRATILSHRTGSDVVKDGEVETFSVETEPRGLEKFVSWFALSKYGQVKSSTGSGEMFSTVFTDIRNVGGRTWLGVRASNATFVQDSKAGQDAIVTVLGRRVTGQEAIDAINSLFAGEPAGFECGMFSCMCTTLGDCINLFFSDECVDLPGPVTINNGICERVPQNPPQP